jgi:hypothetical protein
LKGRGGLRHGPVHWSANFDEIQDFEHDIRGPFEGRGFMSDADFETGSRDTPLGDAKATISPELDALAAYVTSLERVTKSPFRNPDGSFTADALLGATLFHSGALGCAECHGGVEFTDSGAFDFSLKDVGTLGAGSGGRLGEALTGIDTPTLKGLWETAPYFHDGSADDLTAVLTTRNPANLHGNTSQLSAAEIAQLARYLLELEETDANCLTGGPFDLPSEPAPADGAEGFCSTPTLSWKAVPGAASYDVYFSTASEASAGLPGFHASVDTNELEIFELEVETTYLWRVDALSASCASRGDVWSFTTRAQPTIDLVTGLSRYTTGTLSTGGTFYSDRDYVISSMPQELEGSLAIITANDDKAAVSPAWIVFTLLEQANVYVAYDGRAAAIPEWLREFTSTGETIETTDAPLDLYVKEFDPGLIALGGNLAFGAVGAGSNYAVLVAPTAATGSASIRCGDEVPFVRADANGDGGINIADPSFVANFVFGVGAATTPPCLDAADANGDGAVNIADPAFIANFVFGIAPATPPPSPGPSCGTATAVIGCDTPPDACQTP